MTMKRWNGTSFADLSIVKRWNGSAWVDLSIAKRWNGSSWVDIPLPGGGAGPLSVTISPGTAYGENNVPNAPFPSAVNVTSNTVAANVTGGTGTISYSWARVSGSSSVSADTPNAATTSFSATLTRNTGAEAVFRVTVVRGAETATADVSVQLYYSVG